MGRDKKSKAKGKSLPPVNDSKAPTQTEDILNSILPPREWTEDGQLWIQYVSSTPATRLDVVNLQEQLDLKLQQRQARETGICPVREQLKAELNKKTKEVEMTKLDLTRRVEELKQFCEDTAEGFKENQAALEKKNSDELQQLKKINSALKAELEDYLTVKK